MHTIRRLSAACARQVQLAASLVSHARVPGATTALGGRPHDILGRVLDVAGLAMEAVLRIDLQPDCRRRRL